MTEPTILIPQTKSATIRQEGVRVLVIVEGRLVLDLPWEAALQVAQAIQFKAKAAEEFAKAEQIALDQALLMRSGTPVGLTDNPDILKQAANEAAWNSALRRRLPAGGIRSGERFGRPTVKKGRP